MRTEVIKADSIDVAVERILHELGSDTRRSSNRENAIYFDGWDGLGASAVLQAVAKRLTPSNEALARPVGLEFQRIIYIDCSKWENRRAMQREIAQQLKLPSWVIDMFDKQDEEDDFNGLDQGSRGEIEQVNAEINQAIQISRFLVILHNGGNEEIDISNFGLYLYGYANSKMLWTFRGRFRLDPKVIDNVKKSTTTHVVISATSGGRDPQNLWSYLVHHEVAQVSRNKDGYFIIDPAIAAECAKYMLKRCCIGHHIVDYDWVVHTSNYWVCDGIITLADIERAWQVGDVLQRELRLLGTENRHNIGDLTIMPSSHLSRSTEHIPYWISKATCRFVLSPCGVMPDDMFQHSHRLGVLKLSRCTFSFSLPPFLCCHSLRFLWLDHCQDIQTRTHNIDAEKEEELDHNTTVLWECFQSLWVLDLRHTDCDQILSARVMDLMIQLRELNVMGARNWDMSHLQGRLRNIRKLRVTKSTCYFNNNVFSDMWNMELLDFSGNIIRQGMTTLSGPESNNSLKTVIIGGCDGLKIISFRGCKELKNLFLKGSLGNLNELDLSGTRVKTLDFGGVETSSIPKKLILLGCEKLRAILWPQKVIREGWFSVLLSIDTMSTSTSANGGEAPLAHPHVDPSIQRQKEEIFKARWRISLMDTRFLRSLSPVRWYLGGSSIHIDVCDAATVGGSNIQGTSSDELVQVQPHTSTLIDSKYRDLLKGGPVATVMMRDCPKIFVRQWTQVVACIINVIMHGQSNKLLEDNPSITSIPGQADTCALLLPHFLCEAATSLHVYDNPAITSIPAPPQGSGWRSIRWCRMERCPKLHTVFTTPEGSNVKSFFWLETFWASQLLSACYIWDRPTQSYFYNLNLLHLDHCPRLVHVLPFSKWEGDTLGALETLEIVYCGDLREVFPLDPQLQEQDKILEFPKLRHIHLHELPMLQRISGCRMWAPKLETIKIRGCCSLKRLPLVGRNTMPPKVDCEKEWWDNLEWDGLEKYHHPSLYEPSHSLY
ncbi:hypothetical protein CFC21_090925 [Triticum aestivum]|uniref:Disease resistance protein At4g27190-like leucine-rich repeats domain-containing protein n=2 Tax=Triticum aestivum TaxID=4565 RepID=A0A9R1MSG5_WHEAT|nr:uncharacterized protein LOC123143042 [Triticum aestivum]KAF7087761.1 hypothetical protein CFC21_090925 [Triticum aestivum]